MVANKLDLQKRQHRERSQPLKRQRFGLLEKHADYVKRARDFHSKEDRIKKMREKAEGRNKDEFYFGMINSRTQKGVHVQSRGNESLPMDLVKVLKTQDAGYIRTQRAIEESRVQRLQQQINTLITSPGAGTNADDSDDEYMMDFDAPGPSSGIKRKHITFESDLTTVRNATPQSLLPKIIKASTSALSSLVSKRRSKKNLVPEISPEELAATEALRQSSAAAHHAALSHELSERQIRLHNLTRALRELETQRLLMGKGAKASMISKKGTGPATEDENGNLIDEIVPDEGIASGARVFKWKAERKR